MNSKPPWEKAIAELNARHRADNEQEYARREQMVAHDILRGNLIPLIGWLRSENAEVIADALQDLVTGNPDTTDLRFDTSFQAGRERESDQIFSQHLRRGRNFRIIKMLVADGADQWGKKKQLFHKAALEFGLSERTIEGIWTSAEGLKMREIAQKTAKSA